MLTGTLPFTAASPAEWMHCHIARRPARPSEWLSGIPAPVEAIIAKLLAKTGEDRYQTAAGLEADLRHCTTEWAEHGRIEPFALGTHDVSERLLIPEKLYGREAELDALVAAFERVAKHGATERILLSGHAGIGKSFLVDELQKFLVPFGALFAAGKFDQYKRDIPYATLAQAFQSLVRQLLSKDDAELARWRAALQDALGPNSRLMVNMIPELALIIGEPPAIVDLSPGEEQKRFLLAFRRMLGVFARPEHPLVIFLDDMHWVDAATVELFERVVQEPEIGHFLIISAYRDNEVGPGHPLTRMLQTVAAARGEIHALRLGPLTSHDVGRLVADALHAEPDRVQPLAELIFAKTGGNPFFTAQFLNTLADEGVAGIRSRDLCLEMGSGADPCQRHHRRCRGSDGDQAWPPVRRRAADAQVPRLPRQQRQNFDIGDRSRDSRGGDRRRIRHGDARGADPAPRSGLCLHP